MNRFQFLGFVLVFLAGIIFLHNENSFIGFFGLAVGILLGIMFSPKETVEK